MATSLTHGRALRYAGGSARGLLHHVPGHCPHAWLKIAIFTPAGTVQFFQSLGLPGPLAYLVIAAELAGGVALIAGLWTRLVSVALLPILLGAVFAHSGAGFFFTNQGGGWEFPAFWAATLAVQALLGGGAYALKPRG